MVEGETGMEFRKQTPGKGIMDREKLMQYKTCSACGQPFNLGDPVVIACGAWKGPPRWIHEHEAVFDSKTSGYVERKCFEARRGV